MVISYFKQFKFTENLSLAKSKLISVLKTKQTTYTTEAKHILIFLSLILPEHDCHLLCPRLQISRHIPGNKHFNRNILRI